MNNLRRRNRLDILGPMRIAILRFQVSAGLSDVDRFQEEAVRRIQAVDASSPGPARAQAVEQFVTFLEKHRGTVSNAEWFLPLGTLLDEYPPGSSNRSVLAGVLSRSADLVMMRYGELLSAVN